MTKDIANSNWAYANRTLSNANSLQDNKALYATHRGKLLAMMNKWKFLRAPESKLLRPALVDNLLVTLSTTLAVIKMLMDLGSDSNSYKASTPGLQYFFNCTTGILVNLIRIEFTTTLTISNMTNYWTELFLSHLAVKHMGSVFGRGITLRFGLGDLKGMKCVFKKSFKFTIPPLYKPRGKTFTYICPPIL